MTEPDSRDASDDLIAATHALIAALRRYPDAQVAPELREQLAGFVNSLLATTPDNPEEFDGARAELPV